MTPPISCPDRGIITRRSIMISAMAASLLCAPAIVWAANSYAGATLAFSVWASVRGVSRALIFHALEAHLRNLRGDQKTTCFNNRIMSVDVARQQVAHAQAHGFLPPRVCIYLND